MSTILLPIKPQYVQKILNKTKIYEYRKKPCKRKIDKIIIYSTVPIKKVVAEVEVIEVILDTPIAVWNKTKDFGNLSKESFFDYYNNCNIAVVYKLGKVKIYKEPLELKDLGINYYPQSFVYLD